MEGARGGGGGGGGGCQGSSKLADGFSSLRRERGGAHRHASLQRLNHEFKRAEACEWKSRVKGLRP